jgi:hypothetical protein
VVANGTTDVTAALAADIAATPANGTFCLVAGGIYRVDGQLHFRNRNGLTVQGNGATLRQTVELNSAMFLFDQGGNDIHLRNFTISGGNTQSGTYRAGKEYGHGIQFGGVLRASVDHVVFRNMVGEAVYMSGSTVGSGYRESDGISITNNVVDGTGRMGMAITDGANHVTIQGNSLARVALYAFDIEPNGHVFNGIAVGAHDVVIAYNTYVAGSVPHMVSLGGNGQIYNITIRGNHSTGTIRTSVGGSGPRVRNVVIDGNLGDVSNTDYPVELRNSDNVQVINNRQPLRSGQPLVYQASCTAVSISGNT